MLDGVYVQAELVSKCAYTMALGLTKGVHLSTREPLGQDHMLALPLAGSQRVKLGACQ